MKLLVTVPWEAAHFQRITARFPEVTFTTALTTAHVRAEVADAEVVFGDFSRDVLCNRNVENLRVLPVPQCGWSDLGTPLRVTQTLKRLGGGRRVAEASVKMGAQISLAARIEGMQRAGLQL